MKVTPEIEKAMKHVKEFHPEVCMVLFTKDCRWHYMDENCIAPKFDSQIDVSILEDACDSVDSFPYIFQE